MHRTIGIEAAYKMLGEQAPSQLFVTQVRATSHTSESRPSQSPVLTARVREVYEKIRRGLDLASLDDDEFKAVTQAQRDADVAEELVDIDDLADEELQGLPDSFDELATSSRCATAIQIALTDAGPFSRPGRACSRCSSARTVCRRARVVGRSSSARRSAASACRPTSVRSAASSTSSPTTTPSTSCRPPRPSSWRPTASSRTKSSLRGASCSRCPR